MQAFKSNESIDISLSNFLHIITTAAKLFVGTSTIKNAVKCTPWWNSACQTAVRNCKKVLNKYRKHRTAEHLFYFKQMKAIARKTLKDTKRESWRAYVSTITKDTPSTELWQKIKQ